MKTTHIIIGVVVLAAAGFAGWWFYKNRQQPRIAPTSAPTPIIQQGRQTGSIADTLRGSANQVLNAAAQKGMTVLGDKLGDLLSSWGK